MEEVRSGMRRPEARLFAKVTRASGEVIDLGQVAGPRISRASRAKGKAGRKRLNQVAKEARDGS